MTTVPEHSDLCIPENVETMPLRDAAAAYAQCGWYVGPIGKKTRHAGSLLGKGWPSQTCNDPGRLYRSSIWESSRCGGLFLHVGRSGAVVFDVDDPSQMPDVLQQSLLDAMPPFQRSRSGQKLRGHWVYRQPDDVVLGNGRGTLTGSWGDVRGKNGIIVAAPTPHPDDGQYGWVIRGEVPPLPAALAEALQPAQHERRKPYDPFRMYDAGTGLIAAVLDAPWDPVEKKGECNKILYWASCRFGEMVLDGVIEEDDARSWLRSAAEQKGMAWDAENNRATTTYISTIESGLTTGRRWGA